MNRLSPSSSLSFLHQEAWHSCLQRYKFLLCSNVGPVGKLIKSMLTVRMADKPAKIPTRIAKNVHMVTYTALDKIPRMCHDARFLDDFLKEALRKMDLNCKICF